MLEKDPDGLTHALSGIVAKDAILKEEIGEKRPKDIVVKIPAIVFLEKDLNGPFVYAHKGDTTKVYPKKYGFSVKKERDKIVFY